LLSTENHARTIGKWRVLKSPLNGKLTTHVKVLRACAILHNYVLNKDKILLDDEGDKDVKDGPVQMGYYPMRLDPNVEEDKIIMDRLHSSVPGQSVVREAIKRLIRMNEMRRPDYKLQPGTKLITHNE